MLFLIAKFKITYLYEQDKFKNNPLKFLTS